MSTLKVNKIRDTAGSADSITLDPNGGAVIAGVTTVSTVKVGSGVTITSDGDIFHTGVCTATSFAGEIPAASIVGVCTSGLTKTGGFGKILQIVQSHYTSAISYNSTTTYADTGLTCNITTASSGHGSVLCLVQGHLGALANSGEDAYAQMNLVRGSTEIGTAFIGAFSGNVGSATNDPTTYQNAVINELDDGTSGGTTYTYKVQFKKLSNAQQAAWNGYNGPSTITLIEIASRL